MEEGGGGKRGWEGRGIGQGRGVGGARGWGGGGLNKKSSELPHSDLSDVPRKWTIPGSIEFHTLHRKGYYKINCCTKLKHMNNGFFLTKDFYIELLQRPIGWILI